jgi:hypothetical protein
VRHVFNVFGRIVAMERINDRWSCFLVGADGKRRPMELAIPPELGHDELAQYLYDVYHENATPTNGDVFEVPDR